MSHIVYKPYFGEQAVNITDSSHDSFDSTKFRNWLSNDAGIGHYAHGRIHQQVGNTVFVSDLIHKRGHLVSDDILLMEEQNLLSMGEPLSAPSRLGELVTMAVLPTMNTANGEGALIAYYQNGVVSFDTFESPRETRHDGEGKVIQPGWDSKRLVNHLLNTISAVGRYAVAILTRDHLFRSVRGLHFLKTSLGEGSFNTEQTNRISTDVDVVLEKDEDLSGAAVGFWVGVDRMVASTGLYQDNDVSAASCGRGFVVWNQATTYTENRTPIPAWEGVWVPDSGIAGIHMFVPDGFVCSDSSLCVTQAVFDLELESDVRSAANIPIEWSFETGQVVPAGLNKNISVNGFVIEMAVSSASKRVRVLVRTDRSPVWSVWREMEVSDKTLSAGERLLFSEHAGKPPTSCREATWVQLRVEGLGYAEIRLLELDFSPSVSKAGRSGSFVVGSSEKDPFETNLTPSSNRWPQD